MENRDWLYLKMIIMKKIIVAVIFILAFAGFSYGYSSYYIDEGGSSSFYSKPADYSNIVSTQNYDVGIRDSNYYIYYRSGYYPYSYYSYGYRSPSYYTYYDKYSGYYQNNRYYGSGSYYSYSTYPSYSYSYSYSSSPNYGGIADYQYNDPILSSGGGAVYCQEPYGYDGDTKTMGINGKGEFRCINGNWVLVRDISEPAQTLKKSTLIKKEYYSE